MISLIGTFILKRLIVNEMKARPVRQAVTHWECCSLTSGVNSARGVRRIFFRGVKVIFSNFFPGVKCFFLLENSHFVRPKTNFSGFEKWQKKKEKEKENDPLFLLPFSIFHLPIFNFPSFQLHFPLFLVSFFPVGQQKFPGQKSRGAPYPPPSYATEFCTNHKNASVLDLDTWN